MKKLLVNFISDLSMVSVASLFTYSVMDKVQPLWVYFISFGLGVCILSAYAHKQVIKTQQ